MEIIRGSLDDISRPASSEQTGSRVSSVSLTHSDRMCPATPFSLVVLTNDAADFQVQSSSEGTMKKSSTTNPDNTHSFVDTTNDEDDDDDDDDLKLQKAIEEMIRLDEILSATICKQQEAKRQRMELREKLWQELMQNRSEGRSESAHEAQNTKLFLALEASTAKGLEEEKDFEPVFDTQVLDCDDQDHRHVEKRENRSASTIKSLETDHEEIGEELFKGSLCGASRSKKKHKDFVKRNIELISGEGGQVLLTQTEKERLAELLREIDEEEEDSANGADGEEDMWAVSVLTGQGYTPEPPDLKQLNDIDSRIRRLVPVEEFISLQGSHVHLSMSQGHGSEVGWTCDGDLQPGEKVLQDIKERRGQERRLQEIQQQLEILGQGQEMTDESPDLAEEQLLTLLEECELTESWSQDLEMNTP
ncbi:fibrous sheath-interacting protein 1 [Sphaeramia orbicularis]|uniref:fibrous sheath-interacting protein 1 n=1 Tax=Sphaeramia orbicularis TaxID=375764 RepID=UPI00117D3E03|nr:fibrous sheath-interacting protein 1 [Sphaeramia orbicularis]